MVIAGAVFWVVLLGGLAAWYVRADRRRRRHPPDKEPQEVWDESDPKNRTWRWPWSGGAGP